jgi:hypothetical protein
MHVDESGRDYQTGRVEYLGAGGVQIGADFRDDAIGGQHIRDLIAPARRIEHASVPEE